MNHRLTPPHRLAKRSLVACLVLVGTCNVHGQSATQVGTQVRQVGKPAYKPDNNKADDSLLPVELEAARLSSQLDQESLAEGAAVLRRGTLTLKAERLNYNQVRDEASAQGQVLIEREGNRFSGASLRLFVQRFEGEFLNPSYFFSSTGAGGKASKVQFLDEYRSRAVNGTYSSCRPDDADTGPAWELRTRSLQLDLEANVGLAEGAVVHFYGVPILAAPRLSFPLGDQRMSGWLPPKFYLDTRSGVEFGVPYYWNIAPQRDATITPKFITRRGAGLETEFRYLTPSMEGGVSLDALPRDRMTKSARWAWGFKQNGQLPMAWRYDINTERVSDDAYWKDFHQGIQSLTPRLLANQVSAHRDLSPHWGQARIYSRVQQWQVLQDLDPLSRMDTPYQRSPQIGLRWEASQPRQVDAGLTLEYNRFDLPRGAAPTDLPTGSRVHALGHVGVSFGDIGWWLKPKLAINAASYELDRALRDGRRRASRTIPTFSVDQGWVLERQATVFGRALRQTLEPRFFYVKTPFEPQSQLPNFDSAPKDYNFDSIYTDNAFSGVDRVSDGEQLTIGVSSRMTSLDDGEELLRLGVVQRVLFNRQQITADGTPNTQKLSDLLLLGAAHLSPHWWVDGSVQYSAESHRTVRTVVSMRYSPGPLRTVNTTYRMTRGQSEQAEVGWQWPLFADQGSVSSAVRKGSQGTTCSGAWYSVGRVLYSMRDRRITDSLVGLEYDAGCWIGRIVMERRSTGRAEATTGWWFQLELVGLGRIGKNPLNVLRDNIPGYRLLREDRATPNDASYD